MTATLAENLTVQELSHMLHELIRNRSYQRETRLGGAVAEYLAWARLRLAPRSLVIYEGYLARLCILLADRDPALEDVTVEMLLEGFTEHEEPSFAIVRTAYSNLFRWARITGRRPDNPVDLLPSMRTKPMKVYDIFTAVERAKIIKATDTLPVPWVQRLRVLCFLDLGIRKEEGRLLKLTAFDPVARVVLIHGKGDQERIVPMSDELWTAFMQFRNRRIPLVRVLEAGSRRREDRAPRDDDFLFFPYGCSKTGQVVWTDPTRAISERGMHHWWEVITDQAGVRYRSMHMARHTVATDLATAEADSFTIRDWLGHADVSTTQVYVHNSRGRLSKGLQRLEEYRKAQG